MRALNSGGMMTETTQEDDRPELVEAIAQMQGQMLMTNYILLELVLDIAKSKRDPVKYLSNRFDAVMRRWEEAHTTPESEAHPSNLEAQWMAEAFFALARKRMFSSETKPR